MKVIDLSLSMYDYVNQNKLITGYVLRLLHTLILLDEEVCNIWQKF